MKTRRAIRRTVAGIGAVSLGGLALLAPTLAMAEDVPTITAGNITATSTLLTNDDAIAEDLFTYGLHEVPLLATVTKTPCADN